MSGDAAFAAAIRVLLEPVSIAGLKLRNRITMATMTRVFARDGVPGAGAPAHYARRTRGGVALEFLGR